MIREIPADAGLLPGQADLFTYLAFVFLIVAIVAIFSLILWILGLPGKIAVQRRHPHAQTVRLMGYAGALAVIPWIHAFIWAYHDSLTVDIRRFPKEEDEAIDKEIAEMTGEDKDKKTPAKAEIDRPTRLPDPAGETGATTA
ncbi:DUF3302 domain-containing protein [Bauldia sp.]|uniref:DUF3302 domain-containing protein n=1 Tax=Bauldia sp. TaxID=2575872 RepID=UPI003BAB82C8